jgi:hypothetical protein
MKCFYDPTQDAIGTCKSCCKGLSKEHAVDLGKGLACKGRCEEDVRNLIDLIDRNVSLSGASVNLVKGSGKTVYAASLFLLSAGAAFLVMGIVRDFDTFLTVLGAIFVAYGVFTILRARSISASMKSAAEQRLSPDG